MQCVWGQELGGVHFLCTGISFKDSISVLNTLYSSLLHRGNPFRHGRESTVLQNTNIGQHFGVFLVDTQNSGSSSKGKHVYLW